MPFLSISLSLADKVFGFIPSTESRNWLNLHWPSFVMLRRICTVNFFPIILKVLSIGHAFIASCRTLQSSPFNLPSTHLITILSLSNLYAYLCISNIRNNMTTQTQHKHQWSVTSNHWRCNTCGKTYG